MQEVNDFIASPEFARDLLVNILEGPFYLKLHIVLERQWDMLLLLWALYPLSLGGSCCKNLTLN